MIFQHAISVMNSDNSDVFPPTSFQSYLQQQGLDKVNTAQAISVDRLDHLAPELKAAGVMVFRLGQAPEARNTKFALARQKSGWSDYFLQDEDLYRGIGEKTFHPILPAASLSVFRLLPKPTETSFVNLAVASGLLGGALGIDDPDKHIIAGTGHSTFDLKLQPHPLINAIWEHDRGQVEIDALFCANRNGRQTLFIVEAKTSQKLGSLGKHKLAYPLLALRKHIPDDIDIVPVYLRIIRKRSLLHFYFCECTIPKGDISVASLIPTTNRQVLLLEGFGS
jgi:hypothetical protein